MESPGAHYEYIDDEGGRWQVVAAGRGTHSGAVGDVLGHATQHEVGQTNHP